MSRSKTVALTFDERDAIDVSIERATALISLLRRTLDHDDFDDEAQVGSAFVAEAVKVELDSIAQVIGTSGRRANAKERHAPRRSAWTARVLETATEGQGQGPHDEGRS